MKSRTPRFILLAALSLGLAACGDLAMRPGPHAPEIACPAPPAAPVCPATPGEKPKAAVPAMATAEWRDLPGWQDDDVSAAFPALLASCRTLEKQALWKPVCAAARKLKGMALPELRAWFESELRPWSLTNSDGSKTGLITGYYEPILRGSRQRSAEYANPVFAPPDDMIVVELADLYPELKHMRLRGRIEGRKLVPYYSRAEWNDGENKTGERRPAEVLLWIDDAIDLFFMQIQGSGQVVLDDGERVRLNYADQNGHPYRSIGRWLIDKGELKPEQASMQGIKDWARANPTRLNELLDVNPSLVFFRELKLDPAHPTHAAGPPGAMGIPLTAERSIAIDPRHVPLGVPVWLATTQPYSKEALNRLMVAQDTGGAIRGVVRADFFWGSGPEAGSQAGKMRQSGRMWVLMPKAYAPASP